MAAAFRVEPGTFVVTPAKSSFTTEEDVILSVQCTVQRKNGAGSWLTWQTDYKVYGPTGQVLKTISRSHSMAPWTEIDTAADDFEVNLGKFSEGILSGSVAVSAHG
jgi:hypothetical protein